MIYFTAGEQHVVIMEPQNVERIKNGCPLVTPDQQVLVAYTPDILWLSEELEKLRKGGNELDVEDVDRLLKDGLKRPEVHRTSDPMKKVL